MKKYLTALLDLLLPDVCVVCGRRMVHGESVVCTKCHIDLPYQRYRDLADNDVTRLFFGTVDIRRGYCHFAYQRGTNAGRIVMALKYAHRPEIGRAMGRQMAQCLGAEDFFEGVDALVPVPLHWLRYCTRGYNQSRELARGISAATGIPIRDDVLRRVRYNNPQHKRGNRSKRYENARGLFVSRPCDCSHVLLIDDVLTTGATMLACAESIAKANPNIAVSVIALARTK